ncbi:hypothetical protein PC9H_001645 [Pleurotus ostreatus]|uniref:Small ribosomal subunit protein uS7 domain-containing protein n=2 Tax=Pleurotus ostreatus TaxID=5322 RepID=A0A8H7A7B0_PLEOS|nr:uncharacterized protein PC9H_001645 [Pleurotus ostreatus]KAF7441296.1 hypothetical protein PC9H_001645 [Pleurotus ostreatus]
MLASVRAATRAAPRCIRTISTGSAGDTKTFQDAYMAFGASLPNAVAKTSPVPQPTLMTSGGPSIMDIPPAEDPLLNYFTSSIMQDGKRARAARITSRMLLHIHAATGADPVPTLREAVRLASPAVKSLIHRVASKNVAKPVALGEKQRVRYAVQWILKASEKKAGRTIEERLAKEIIGITKGSSEVLKTKEEVHRFAMVNRGNARSRV